MSSQSTFVLMPGGMLRPTNPKDFDGWLRSRIKIISGPFKDEKGEMCYEGRLPSQCVSFTFSMELEKATAHRKVATFKPKYKNTQITYRKTNEKQLDREDIRYMLSELPSGSTAGRNDIDRLFEKVPVDIDTFKANPIFTKLELAYQTEYFRHEYDMALLYAMPNQKAKIRSLKGNDFETAYGLIMKRPWELCFTKYTKPIKLKEMDNEGFTRHCIKHKIVVAPMYQCAVRIYAFVKERRDAGNTIFPAQDLGRQYLRDESKWGRIAYENSDDSNRVTQAMLYLFYHAFVGLDEDGVQTRQLDQAVYLCFRADLERCYQVVNTLRTFNGSPLRRGPDEQVPCIPANTLSDTQQAFIKHVFKHRFTFLLGGPGTGKSECLVGLMALFKKPLVVTFVGMMVDALQKRFGGRVETVHTIHSIYYSEDTEWLSQFDMIIIDEFSNVDTHLFAKLLISVPSTTRLVCAGDLGQIYPIKPGCPFKDLVEYFPQHVFVLKENKRVDPDSLELANASVKITENRPRDLVFGGPLKLGVRDDEVVREAVRAHGKDDIMQFQAVALLNRDRKHLNALIEETLIQEGVLRPSESRTVVSIFGSEGKMDIFEGKKIAFTKNTKSNLEGGFDGVRNGELGCVKNVQMAGNNSYIISLTNGKRILIGGEGGVEQKHVCPGYATTCNKAQGSEWAHILFWIYENPNRFFTREFPYVAVSRAKKSCIIAGMMKDLESLCSKRAASRDTLLRYLLSISDLEEPLNEEDPVVLPDFSAMELLPLDVPAVPIHSLSSNNEQEEKLGGTGNWKKKKTSSYSANTRFLKAPKKQPKSKK